MNYILMNKNMEVLKFSYDEETHTIQKIEEQIHPEFAPPGIIEYKTGISRKAFNDWWRDRAIPASRSKFKDIMEELHIFTSVELLERCLGLSLSDQYWIKETTSPVKWENVNFFEHTFSEDMGKLLMGQIEHSDSLDMCSPDNSSDGNLKKKWKIIANNRCLLKGGNSLNNQEPFNEVIASNLYELILGKDEYVPYTLIEENGSFYSCCKTMVNTYQEFVPAYYIDRMQKLRGSESLYEHYVQICQALGIQDARVQIDKMIVCDYLLANFDRHYRNFGVIRNVETLKWEKIAPIFDSGSSLWATTPTKQIGSSYKSKPFLAQPEKQLDLVKDFDWLDIDRLDKLPDIIKTVLIQNPLLDDIRIEEIRKAVIIRIEHLRKRVQ